MRRPGGRPRRVRALGVGGRFIAPKVPSAMAASSGGSPALSLSASDHLEQVDGLGEHLTSAVLR
jgi:hypothetical protein